MYTHMPPPVVVNIKMSPAIVVNNTIPIHPLVHQQSKHQQVWQQGVPETPKIGGGLLPQPPLHFPQQQGAHSHTASLTFATYGVWFC